MPVDSDAFDIILCTNSFHHYQNPEKALGEIFRLLKQRGRFYVMDVTADNWLIRRIDTQVKKRENEHVKFYSTAEFCALFRGVGMSYVSSRTLWPPKSSILLRKKGAPLSRLEVIWHLANRMSGCQRPLRYFQDMVERRRAFGDTNQYPRGGRDGRSLLFVSDLRGRTPALGRAAPMCGLRPVVPEQGRSFRLYDSPRKRWRYRKSRLKRAYGAFFNFIAPSTTETGYGTS